MGSPVLDPYFSPSSPNAWPVSRHPSAGGKAESIVKKKVIRSEEKRLQEKTLKIQNVTLYKADVNAFIKDNYFLCINQQSMEGIEIKPYDDRLKQEVGALIVSIQHDEFLIPIDLEAQPDLTAIPSFYQVNNGNFWVALYNNEVVGTIALLDIGNQMGALRKMFVRKDVRGKEWGVGQALLNTLLTWAKEKNYTTIYLGTTEKFLAAQRFYEKNGFEEVDKHLLPATFPVMNVDVKFYKHQVQE